MGVDPVEVQILSTAPYQTHVTLRLAQGFFIEVLAPYKKARNSCDAVLGFFGIYYLFRNLLRMSNGLVAFNSQNKGQQY